MHNYYQLHLRLLPPGLLVGNLLLCFYCQVIARHTHCVTFSTCVHLWAFSVIGRSQTTVVSDSLGTEERGSLTRLAAQWLGLPRLAAITRPKLEYISNGRERQGQKIQAIIFQVLSSAAAHWPNLRFEAVTRSVLNGNKDIIPYLISSGRKAKKIGEDEEQSVSWLHKYTSLIFYLRIFYFS